MISMASIRSKNTRPELVVRRMLHALGFRFRLHRSDLPGTPDIVFPSKKKVVFVHGCFWHRHSCDWGRKVPPGKPEYWKAKFARNVTRDTRDVRALEAVFGWTVLIIWECEVKNPDALRARLLGFL